MKKLFGAFWSRNIAAARLAILSHLEYRLDFFIDCIFQPATSAGIELALWATIFSAAQIDDLNGFSKASYFTYILWATFVARVSANWYYEMEMGDEIETGRINAILIRPISFFEYYLSQFLGYKIVTLGFSFLIPATLCLIFPATIIWIRIIPMLALILFYLLFTYTISFCVSCLGFSMTRVRGITVLKNMSLWVLSGELFPLDMIPDPWRSKIIALPFASGVYVPVAFLTGRVGWQNYFEAMMSISVGFCIVAIAALAMWRQGLRSYTGTGA